MNLADLEINLGGKWKKWLIALVGVLAIGAGAYLGWKVYHKPNPPVPAQQQAQEAITTATQALAEVNKNIKKGKALIKKLPGEVKKIEENAISASQRATLDELAGRANARIRDWVTQHPTGNSVQPSKPGDGSVLPGGSGKTQ